MTGPYRRPPETLAPDVDSDAAHDDVVLALLLLALGGLRVALAIGTGEVWGIEPSVAMLMTGCGAGLLLHRKLTMLDLCYLVLIAALFVLTVGLIRLFDKL